MSNRFEKEYLPLLNSLINNYRELRVGQCMFEALYDMDATTAKNMLGTDLDPYNEKDWNKCQKFLDFVKEHLDGNE